MGPDRMSSLGNRPSAPFLNTSEESQPRNLTQRFNSSHSQNRHGHPPRFDGSPASREALPSSATGAFANRRNTHESRLSDSSPASSGYPTSYGSAPDQNGHQVSLLLIVDILFTNGQSADLKISFRIEPLIPVTVNMPRWGLSHCCLGIAKFMKMK